MLAEPPATPPIANALNQEDPMKLRSPLSIAIAVALIGITTSSAWADGNKGKTFSTRLSGYNETPLTLNSSGSGEFSATVNKDGSISYTLSYRDLASPVLQSHIHFGRPAITGQIVLFLCTNLTPPVGVPAPQACPQQGTISGTLTAADVIARPTQGIDGAAAGLAEMVKAMRASAAYANVHTQTFPSGEIRGTVGPGDDEDENDDD
jgi:hypothetical protein